VRIYERLCTRQTGTGIVITAPERSTPRRRMATPILFACSTTLAALPVNLQWYHSECSGTSRTGLVAAMQKRGRTSRHELHGSAMTRTGSTEGLAPDSASCIRATLPYSPYIMWAVKCGGPQICGDRLPRTAAEGKWSRKKRSLTKEIKVRRSNSIRFGLSSPVLVAGPGSASGCSSRARPSSEISFVVRRTRLLL